jgi:hypothetical protein
MDQMAREYEGQAHFLFVYTREAHPEHDHEVWPELTTIEQKWAHAKAMQERHNTPRKILIDDLEGTVHRAWAGTSNMSWILDHTGRVHFKSNWTHEPDIRASLDSAVKMRALKREGGPANQYFTEAVWYARDRDQEGFFEQELAKQAEAEKAEKATAGS